MYCHQHQKLIELSCVQPGQSWSAVLPRKHLVRSPYNWNRVQVSFHWRGSKLHITWHRQTKSNPHSLAMDLHAQVTEPGHSEKLLHELGVLCRRLVNRTVHLQLPTAKKAKTVHLCFHDWHTRHCHYYIGSAGKLQGRAWQEHKASIKERQDTHEYFKLVGRQFPISAFDLVRSHSARAILKTFQLLEKPWTPKGKMSGYIAKTRAMEMIILPESTAA